MMQKAILIGPEGLEKLANHEKAVCSLAALTGDLTQAEKIGETHTSVQIKEIIDYVAMGINIESAKELVNTRDSL